VPQPSKALLTPKVFVELILIIVGILTALAIDGWAQDRRDRHAERQYLELLRDDLVLIEDQLRGYADFETANLETAVSLYAALAPGNDERDAVRIQSALAGISVRRTVQVTSAAYTDLQSTGNLQLIRNPELRQQMIRYFALTERLERVIEKNNTAFIDDIYMSSLLEIGVTIGFSPSNEPSVALADDMLREALSRGPAMPTDKILLQPPGAPSWDDLRRLVVFRARISAVGVRQGNQGVQSTQDLRTAIEAELRNPI
jgi:hypothetical protein